MVVVVFNGAMLFWRSAQAVGEIDGVSGTRVGDLSQGAARIGSRVLDVGSRSAGGFFVVGGYKVGSRAGSVAVGNHTLDIGYPDTRGFSKPAVMKWGVVL